MINLYEQNGRWMVTVDGLVIGQNLSRAEASKLAQSYDQR